MFRILVQWAFTFRSIEGNVPHLESNFDYMQIHFSPVHINLIHFL